MDRLISGGTWEAIGTGVYSSNGREIVFGAHMTRGADAPERRANALLIAAAPDLLAACERAINGDGSLDGMRAALEKAMGVR